MTEQTYNLIDTLMVISDRILAQKIFLLIWNYSRHPDEALLAKFCNLADGLNYNDFEKEAGHLIEQLNLQTPISWIIVNGKADRPHVFMD